MRTIVKVKQVFRNIKNQMLLVENIYTDLDLELDKEYSMEKIISLIDSLKEMKSQNNIESIFIDKDSSVTIKF